MKRKMKGQGCGFGGGSPIPGFDELASVFSKNKSFHSSSPFLIRQIEYYQQFIDPARKRRLGVKRICLYSPTCSEYTKSAIKRRGALVGTAMGIKRIISCRPR